MPKPRHRPDPLAFTDPVEFAIDKGRLYGIADLLDMEDYHACARDVRAAADYIERMRKSRAH